MTYRFFAITSLASDITDRSRAIRRQVKEEFVSTKVSADDIDDACAAVSVGASR